MTKNFLCLFSIKRMWELLGTLRSRWALYFSEVLPSWNQSIEMSLPSEVGPPRLQLGRSGERLSFPSGCGPPNVYVFWCILGINVCWRNFTTSESITMQQTKRRYTTSASLGRVAWPRFPLDPPLPACRPIIGSPCLWAKVELCSKFRLILFCQKFTRIHHLYFNYGRLVAYCMIILAQKWAGEVPYIHYLTRPRWPICSIGRSPTGSSAKFNSWPALNQLTGTI